MTRTQELMRNAPLMNPQEEQDISDWQRRNVGLATAPSSLFDMEDIFRILVYRRAVKAGMYTDQTGDPEDSGWAWDQSWVPAVEVQEPVRTGTWHWHDVAGNPGAMRQCNC